MAGHSKWAQIKRQKAANDHKKGQIFSKLSREIYVAVREAGPSPDTNVRLRMAIERAKREGMSSDTVERAIAKGSGASADGVEYQTVFYEGYGPGGVAVMAVALTDNRNRTAAEVRQAFNRHGGSLGETGTVGWQFDTIGQVIVAASDHDSDEIELQAIEAGATDVSSEDGEVMITTEASEVNTVAEALRSAGLEVEAADITRVPQNQVEIDGAQAQTAMKLLEALEDLDDIQEVFTNASFSEETAAV
ncbi:MAG TPA: YebC/PmpR family DNA-binding transcriptional regulator [Thermomicrobiales bacterium]|nr:YebC/PmpR family DNA-binding transcriptional regulator [Thermomicrobiales bacterium]